MEEKEFLITYELLTFYTHKCNEPSPSLRNKTVVGYNEQNARHNLTVYYEQKEGIHRVNIKEVKEVT